MFSAKKLATLQHGIKIQLSVPRGRDTVWTSPRTYKIFYKSLVSPRGWTSVLTTCRLNAVRLGVWGSSPLSSPAGHLAASHCDPSCNFFTRPPPSRRSGLLSSFTGDHTKAEGRCQSEPTWNRTNGCFLSLTNPLPLQGLNDKISSRVWQNGMALFHFKGMCAIIKKVIYQV